LVIGTVAPTIALSAKGKLTEEQKILHLLNRIGFGPRPGDVARVKKMGLDKFLDQQLHPERIDGSTLEARLKGLDSLKMTVAEIYQKYPQPNDIARRLGLMFPAGAPAQVQPGQSQPNQPQAEARQKVLAYYIEHGLKQPPNLLQELQAQKLIRAVYSERQLEEVLTDFWFNHFNVHWNKGADKWLTTDYEMNAIRPNVLGKFKDLVLATAKSPAMLFYLDNHLSSSPDADRPLRRDVVRPAQSAPLPRAAARRQQRQQERQLERRREQAARMEQRQQPLNANQPQRRKPGINENYARELMELHTMGVDGGYTQKDVQEVARCFTGWTIERPVDGSEFIFRERMHDDGEKVVLGQKIPAGGGMKDGEKVIDILVHHPSTARFIATKLVRRFTSDEPPKSLVDRVAAVYKKTDGDIREMLKAIFTSKEFNSPDVYRAKIKSPFELVVSAIRALDGETNGSPRLAQMISRMGQPLYQYQAPTGYPDRASQWVNTGTLLERLNFGLALAANRIQGTQVDVKRIAALNRVEPDQALNRAIAVILNNEVSSETRRMLEKQLKENAVPGPAEQAVVFAAFGYVLGSPEFQRR
jgi:uncharacterized protein (DUF1800 family)